MGVKHLNPTRRHLVQSEGPIRSIYATFGSAGFGDYSMHFHMPKPMHGWREFLGEVGIIVFGVLIALSAEQVD